MSFEPLTGWVLRCDAGLCPELVRSCHRAADPHDPDTWQPTVFAHPNPIDPDDDHVLVAWLHRTGWLLLRDGRVLCPDHVHALAAGLRPLPGDGRYPLGGAA